TASIVLIEASEAMSFRLIVQAAHISARGINAMHGDQGFVVRIVLAHTLQPQLACAAGSVVGMDTGSNATAANAGVALVLTTMIGGSAIIDDGSEVGIRGNSTLVSTKVGAGVLVDCSWMTAAIVSLHAGSAIGILANSTAKRCGFCAHVNLSHASFAALTISNQSFFGVRGNVTVAMGANAFGACGIAVSIDATSTVSLAVDIADGSHAGFQAAHATTGSCGVLVLWSARRSNDTRLSISGGSALGFLNGSTANDLFVRAVQLMWSLSANGSLYIFNQSVVGVCNQVQTLTMQNLVVGIDGMSASWLSVVVDDASVVGVVDGHVGHQGGSLLLLACSWCTLHSG
ncbi:MAG: hypothetical protein COB82_08920, partial [Marinobacter sp.]